jgi:RNA polymerase sigma-70 factor (ECF subfamily)
MPATVASDPPDADLAKRAGAGDERAFAQLVRRYERPVYALCCRYLGTADGADAAQETFVRAFTGLERYDRERPLLPWLLTIARHVSIDHQRARKHETGPSRDGAEDPGASASVEPVVAAREELALVAAALRQLPDGPREAIALFHFHDLSYKEIAEQLEIPMGTVMTWIHRGRDALRQALSGPGAGVTAAARRVGRSME